MEKWMSGQDMKWHLQLPTDTWISLLEWHWELRGQEILHGDQAFNKFCLNFCIYWTLRTYHTQNICQVAAQTNLISIAGKFILVSDFDGVHANTEFIVLDKYLVKVPNF